MRVKQLEGYSMKILVAYASVHGSTGEIAQFISNLFKAYAAEVECAKVEDIQDISSYDVIILGTAIHEAIWLTSMLQFLDRFKAEIATKITYMFITCIRVLETDGYEHVMKNYVHTPTVEALHIREVQPFAGKMKLDHINWNERWLLGLRYDGNELKQHFNGDYRDWYAISTWVNKIAQHLSLKPSFES